jgi:hypothetical protein
MPDSNLNTSISAMRTVILNDLPTATVAELVDLSRAAKSLNLANDSTVETAINNRAVALINGGATQAEIIKISQAVKSVLSPATFANNIANFTTITSSLIPDTDVSYDLGTSSNRFNDIYLDGNTIDLGGQTIKSTATGIEVPEITIGSGTNKVKLSANSSGKLEQVGTNSGGVVQDTVTGSGPASTAVTNLSELTAISSPATGQSVLVTSTNKLYIYNGTGWYLIAEVTNLSPTAITGLNATYDLATDGTSTTITLNSTDPEGATLTWSHAVTTGTLGSTATITNVDNVFTITPSTTEADGGSFSVTFSASDGSQAATSASDFTLQFAAPASSVLFDVTGNYYEPTGAQSSAGEGTIFSWTVPTGVTSICVCCIGGGGGGSGNGHYSGTPYLWSGGGGFGGALAWMNDITVTPGEVLTLRVGWAAGQSVTGVYSGQTMYGRTGPIGGFSQLKRGSTEIMKAEGGLGGLFSSSTVQAAATYTVSSSHGSNRGGGNGGLGGKAQSGSGALGGGGGGAGGYSGAGGNGAFSTWGASVSHGGSGGGGGGGGKNGVTSNPRNGGGGVGIYGEGSSGVAVAHYGTGQTGAGNGGSGGTNAIINHPFYGGGTYGGGGGSLSEGIGFNRPGAGGSGVIRIMWGAGRAYPSTNVDNSSNVDAETVVT